MNAKSTPTIEVVGGEGGRLELRRGLSLIGRDEGADLRLSSPEVSVRHAWIRRDDRTTWITDANSTNGTRLNGRRLTGDREQRLHHRDTLEFGPVKVVYRDSAPSAPADGTRVQRSSDVSYGDVSAGTFNHAGRDIHNSYDQRRHNRFEVISSETDAIHELAVGRGASRAVMALGLLTMVVGFGIWTYVIFHFIATIPTDTSGPGPDFGRVELLGPPVWDGVPLGVVGFALCGIGGIVHLIGMVMSKSARERERRRDG